MSQPTDPTRPTDPRDPGAQAPAPGRRASDSRQTFPDEAPRRPSSPPPGARTAPPIVPQIGHEAQSSSDGGRPNPYGPAGARYASAPRQEGAATGTTTGGQQTDQRPQEWGQTSQSAIAASQDPQTGDGAHTGPVAYAAGPAQTDGAPHPQDSFHAGGQPPAGPASGNRRRGPGWGALIAAAVAAAIVGGALGGGGAWLLSGDSSPVAQEQTEPNEPAPGDQTLDRSTETPDWAQIADQTMPVVASIQVGVGGEVSGLGSGFVYDAEGHVITNNHVVAPADTDGGEVQVTMSDGSMIPATLVGRDPETDVAVLKLDTVPEDLTPLSIGASDDLFVGDPVMALGNPLGLADTVTTGIVSALNRPVSTENIGDVSEQEVAMTITNAIQTDAAINPGNSGGPLVNGNGEVVGINSSAATLSDPTSSEAQSGSIGIGFAITIEQATGIANQLIETGEAKHPLLGVTMVNSSVSVDGITRGSARVTAVENGTPAATAGFQEDDEIIAVGDEPVNSGVNLQALVRSSSPDEPVEFTVVRDGQEETLSATLELR